MFEVTSNQLRLARALLDMSLRTVASEAELDLNTVRCIEAGSNPTTVTYTKLVKYYTARGVEFGQRGTARLTTSEHIPTLLRVARIGLRLEQKAVAEASGVAYSTIRSVERRNSNPTPATCKKLRDFYMSQGAVFGSDGSLRIARASPEPPHRRGFRIAEFPMSKVGADQFRVARALLGVTLSAVAEEIGLNTSTVRIVEMNAKSNPTATTYSRLVEYYTVRGVIFGDRGWVRLPSTSDTIGKANLFLRAARIGLRLEQKAVAEATGLSCNTIQKVEYRDANPTRTTYTKLRDFYLFEGVEFDDNGWIRIARTSPTP